MMPLKRTLQLREIQKIFNLLETMKKVQHGPDGKETSPNYSAKWSASTQYWMGRLAGFCESITKHISTRRDELLKKHTKDGIIEQDAIEAFNKDIKDLLDTEDTIRFPELKASHFVRFKKDKQGKDTKEIEESLVPMEFWTVFSKYLEMDVEEFAVPEEEEEISEVEYEEQTK